MHNGDGNSWRLELLDLRTKGSRFATYDAVLVASGHYNDPFIPDVPGLADFNETYPGSVMHSKFYRRPFPFQGKVNRIQDSANHCLLISSQKVVVVGKSASAIDLSAQISTVANTPVIISEKSLVATTVNENSWALMRPKIAEIDPESRAVRFTNGDIECEIDAIVFCTGYFYSFPFLKSISPPIITDGSYARNLYEHILYIEDPTLAFLGIPQRVVPFPISESQSAYVARLWAGRLSLPSRGIMRTWEEAELKEKGESKAIHNLAFPRDVEYINKLHELSLSA